MLATVCPNWPNPQMTIGFGSVLAVMGAPSLTSAIFSATRIAMLGWQRQKTTAYLYEQQSAVSACLKYLDAKFPLLAGVAFYLHFKSCKELHPASLQAIVNQPAAKALSESICDLENIQCLEESTDT